MEPQYFKRLHNIKKCKKISEKLKNRIEGEVKALLHASRDTLRNQRRDTSKITFDTTNPYVGEAFGIMRLLHIMDFGWFGSSNWDGFKDEPHIAKQPENNLRWWFSKLEDEVLKEENYKGDGRCEYCLARYHQDTKSMIEKGLFVNENI